MSEPIIEGARTFNAQHPEAPVSSFACRYPGKYREAADALRQVRKEEKDATE